MHASLHCARASAWRFHGYFSSGNRMDQEVKTLDSILKLIFISMTQKEKKEISNTRTKDEEE